MTCPLYYLKFRQAAGLDILLTSSYDEESYNKLLSYLKKGVTASFIGSSGVGKSTLINCLADEELLTTSYIRNDDKGRHTTTRRELLVLPNGGIVIDTPGMRELGIESVDLTRSFADIEAMIQVFRYVYLKPKSYLPTPLSLICTRENLNSLNIIRLLGFV